MRSLLIILAAAVAVSGRAGAETKTTTRTEFEAGLHYDDNILFPDSVTGQASLREDVYARHRWYSQLSETRMLRTEIHAWGERIHAFPDENIGNVGGDIEYRRYLSRRTMAAVSGLFSYQVSPSEFYQSNHVSAQVLAGHYFSGALYGQASLEGGLRRFPDYYHIDLLTDTWRYYQSMDHLYQTGTVSARVTAGRQWTLHGEYALRYSDYYDDLHDLDYLDSAMSVNDLADPPPIDYTAFRAETSWTPPGSLVTQTDSVWYFGAYNVRQKDLYHRCRIGVDYRPHRRLSVQAGLAGRLYLSSDPYFRYRGGDAECTVHYRGNGFSGRLYYRFLYKDYPDRFADWPRDGRQRDTGHLCRIGISRDLSEHFTGEFRYTFRQVVSNNPDDAFRKNAIAVYLSYKK